MRFFIFFGAQVSVGMSDDPLAILFDRAQQGRGEPTHASNV